MRPPEPDPSSLPSCGCHKWMAPKTSQEEIKVFDPSPCPHASSWDWPLSPLVDIHMPLTWSTHHLKLKFDY